MEEFKPAPVLMVKDLETLKILADPLRNQIKTIAKEEQKYWFDHPIPLDIKTEANEIIYGLNGLNEAVAFEKARPVEGGLPLLHEVQRNNVRICKEKIADYVDPPRFVPMIGPAQLHHAHYKCTIRFREVVRIGWPVPHTLPAHELSRVVYVDHNHYHITPNPGSAAGSPY